MTTKNGNIYKGDETDTYYTNGVLNEDIRNSEYSQGDGPIRVRGNDGKTHYFVANSDPYGGDKFSLVNNNDETKQDQPYTEITPEKAKKLWPNGKTRAKVSHQPSRKALPPMAVI